MRRLLYIFAAVALIAPAASAQKLVILHTNDTHSQILPEKVGEYAGLGGVERRLQYINGVIGECGKDKVLVLDAGDFDQGTPFYTMSHGNLELDMVNALHVDVATLGNHEFDDGPEDLARRLSKARFKAVCCNYDFSSSPLRKYVKPYAIVRRGGMKIGIIGVAPYLEGAVLIEHVKDIKRLNTIDEINRWAAYLRGRRGCDLVILLSHLGFDDEATYDKPDDVMVIGNSRNVDLVIGGHSHTVMDQAYEAKDLDQRIVPIVQVGRCGHTVGRMDIY